MDKAFFNSLHLAWLRSVFSNQLFYMVYPCAEILRSQNLFNVIHLFSGVLIMISILNLCIFSLNVVIFVL